MKTDRSAYRRLCHTVLVVALILMVPLIAMQVTDEVRWSATDFAVAGALLLGTGLMYELATRRVAGLAHHAAVVAGIGAALLLVWADLAVGIIGEPDEAANVLYLGVPVVGILGAVIARLEPRGMARALFATALAQASVAVIVLAFGLGAPASDPFAILALHGFFVALFVGSGLLFRSAARQPPPHQNESNSTPVARQPAS